MPGTYTPVGYLPVLIFLIIALGFGLGSLLFGYILRPRRPYDEKLSTYESGMVPEGEPRQKFSVQYYIIAILFVVFDVEAVFLYPWAVSFDKIGLYAFIEMILFIVVLVIGYIYAWRKDAFLWD
ncbi:NADH-quinone oxidoreductase subunit A [Candidatus Magnetominusculus xianensis]|uniref:NADH-quinone oxidoreductase subunit A n=1 Tax=Candidatus Magnetominusculus xianensis TaxID=1748249 RepID=A0ABR5SJH4_9BACT|nr:NADH-quinone oxidoreductase subunit A [Candidatus Magnetominusculus xianensis]KWT92060.1 NADH-quinone oxidoreductase subunit A [Candidatus Magnetominusculus xianensis]MBF0404640.1 NADH-quinone oxidoreductase subunit A [Nitrospirota bacterium]